MNKISSFKIYLVYFAINGMLHPFLDPWREKGKLSFPGCVDYPREEHFLFQYVLEMQCLKSDESIAGRKWLVSMQYRKSEPRMRSLRLLYMHP